MIDRLTPAGLANFRRHLRAPEPRRPLLQPVGRFRPSDFWTAFFVVVLVLAVALWWL